MFRWIRNSRSLTLRIIILSLISIILLLAITGTAILWAFNKSVEKNLINHLTAYMDVLVAATSVDKDGAVSLDVSPEILGDLPRFWQVSTGNELIKKSPLLKEAINLSRYELDSRLFSVIDSTGTRITFAKRTIKFPSGKKVDYVFGMQTEIAAAYTKQENVEFMRVLISVWLILGASLLLLSYIQIRFIIAPLSQVRKSLSDIRSGKTNQLGKSFPREIQPLADEVNNLLSYSSNIMKRHRTFASNLSHALKTPLAALRNESAHSDSELARLVREKSDNMLVLIERNLARVRTAGTENIIGARTEILPVVEKIARSFGKLYNKEVRVLCDERVFFRGDEGDLYELLGNIIENGCKYGKKTTLVTVTADSNINIVVEDDGPGIPKEKVPAILKGGTRLDERKPGTGIGLSIAREIAELYSGYISLTKSSMGGLKVSITLPIVA